MDPAIELAKLTANQGMDMFLRNFGKIPEDKLTWKPTPTAKSALQVAAHTAVTNSNFADFIRNRAVPSVDNLNEFLERTSAAELAITNKDEMEQAFRANTQKFIDALDTLSQEDLELQIDSGQGWSMSMRYIIRMAGWHATLHCGQIDYIQTCYGDQQIYTG